MLILYAHSYYMIMLIFVWGVRPCSVRVTREINEVGGLSSTQLPNQNRPIGIRVDNCGGGWVQPPTPPAMPTLPPRQRLCQYLRRSAC